MANEQAIAIELELEQGESCSLQDAFKVFRDKRRVRQL